MATGTSSYRLRQGLHCEPLGKHWTPEVFVYFGLMLSKSRGQKVHPSILCTLLLSSPPRALDSSAGNNNYLTLWPPKRKDRFAFCKGLLSGVSWNLWGKSKKGTLGGKQKPTNWKLAIPGEKQTIKLEPETPVGLAPKHLQQVLRGPVDLRLQQPGRDLRHLHRAHEVLAGLIVLPETPQVAGLPETRSSRFERLEEVDTNFFCSPF